MGMARRAQQFGSPFGAGPRKVGRWRAFALPPRRGPGLGLGGGQWVLEKGRSDKTAGLAPRC